MAKDEPREAVSGLPQIQRQYEGAGAASDLGGMTREERAAKYRKDMHRGFAAELEVVRGQAVKRYRAAKQSGEGLDSKYDRWYRAEEWTDDGKYIGEGPCVKPQQPDASVVEERDRQAAARAVPTAPKTRGRPPRGKA